MSISTLLADDQLLLQRFNRQAINRAQWTHAMHLRVGWIHIRLHGVDGANDQLRHCIRRLNDANGVINSDASGYHETLTRFWLRLIDATDESDRRRAASSEAFLQDHPELVDAKLPLRYYTKARLMSTAARRAWVDPDLAALAT